MSDYTPLEQLLYDTGIAMPGDVRRIARKIESSDWLASHDAKVRRETSMPTAAVIVRAARAMRDRKHSDCAGQPCEHESDDAEELQGLARIAIGVYRESRGEAGDAKDSAPKVTAWIDRTLALPIYQDAMGDYDEGVLMALKGVRKMLNGTTRPDASWRKVEPQGEPSDAQVEAAARALFEEPGHDPNSPDFMSWDEVVETDGKRADLWRDDARRVLRAARAVSNEVSATDIGAERHYYPEDDPMKHDIQDDGCACAPTVVELRLKDGSPSRYFVHRSIEAREKNGGA